MGKFCPRSFCPTTPELLLKTTILFGYFSENDFDPKRGTLTFFYKHPDFS